MSRFNRAIIAGEKRASEDEWGERIAALNAMFAEDTRYNSDPEYRAASDADRARRQAVVYDRMGSGIARYRVERGLA